MGEHVDPHLTRVLNDLLDDGAETEPQDGPTPEPPSLEEPVREEPNQSSDVVDFPVTELRDRVVIMLLFNQLVRIEQVEQAWQRWKGREDEALWRVLAAMPGVDTELVYGEAAKLYSFDEADVSKLGALTVISEQSRQIRPERWQKMLELRVIPVSVESKSGSDRRQVVFATHDPVRPEVLRLMETLEVSGYELRYAPLSVIEEIIRRAFPGQSDRLQLETQRSVAMEPAPEPDIQGRSAPVDASAPVIEEDGEVSRSALRDLFEDSLVAAFKQRAREIVYHPNSAGGTEILFNLDERVLRWHTETRIHPKGFMTIIKDCLKKGGGFAQENTVPAAEGESEEFQRWIQDRRVLFRTHATPITNRRREVQGEVLRISVREQ